METALTNVRVLPDGEAAAHAGVRIFTEAAADAISLRNRFSVALSGGSTPKKLCHLLGASYSEKIAWEHVHIFWSDERCVPPDHEQSNFRLANEEFLSRINIPDANIHRIQGELGPTEAAGAYEHELRAHFRAGGIPYFDLILLGIGEDGHTASLFPGEKTVSETERLAVPAFPGHAGNRRVTLTLPVLNNAALVVFLVTGKAKSGIIREILLKGKRDLYPAGAVRPEHGRIIWLLDEDAASGLKGTDQ